MKGIVFDMDDTLYKEHDYRLSGWRLIARCFAASCRMTPDQLYDAMLRNAPQAFETVSHLAIANNVRVTVDDQLAIYRSQLPDISLSDDSRLVLDTLRSDSDVTLGLITDGRPVGQLNKIAALGLRNYIADNNIIVTSLFGTDKHSPFAYELLMQRNPQVIDWTYIGDNPTKDFYNANLLGWHTIMLNDGAANNIFSQKLDEVDDEYRPKTTITNIKQVLELL